MRPVDVATNETIAFVERHLSASPLRILEVGCGKGEVAARLQQDGHHIIAIDGNASVIEQARRLGIDARVAHWPDFEEAAFDVVLFTRSLHHMAPLAASLIHAHDLLLPSGVLLVEDFAYEAIDPRASELCYSLATFLKTCLALVMKDKFLSAFVETGGDFAFWQQNHDHELHTALVMRGTLLCSFFLGWGNEKVLEEGNCPPIALDRRAACW